MHDLDTNMKETFEYDFEQEGVFGEAEVTQMASELMEVQSEAELEQFLGDLIKKAGSAVGSFIKSPTGQALGGLLKSAAKQVLPMAGSALGGLVGGDTGAQLGSQSSPASSATNSRWKPRGRDGNRQGLCSHGGRRGKGGGRRSSRRESSQCCPVTAVAGMLCPHSSLPALLSAATAMGAHRGTWKRHGRKIILMGV